MVQRAFAMVSPYGTWLIWVLPAAQVLAAMQKRFNLSGIVNEKSGPPAWKQLPTWYEVSEYDHVIPPAVERMFAKEMNATTISLPSSSLVSHPTEVAQLILNATKGIIK
jgi:hypothetical protein